MSEFDLLAVGDIFIRDEDAAPYFDATGPILRAADITFGNCEQAYAGNYPAVVPALKRAAGFDIMAFAMNHALDFGEEPFLRTIELLRENGVAVVGAGRNIDEARRPVVVERNGVRVGFLAYSSIQVPGYAAGPGRPGIAPLRAHTAYHEQFEDAPGTPPRIRTFVHDEDLSAMVHDIAQLRQEADVVVLSLHWGPLLRYSELAEYQPTTARIAIDAGADLVLGHHPHIMKGVETYRGKVIFYSVNHFVMRTHAPVTDGYRSAGHVTSASVALMMRTFPGEFGFDPEYPLYPFAANRDTLKTMIARITIASGEITRVAIIPCVIGRDYQPVPLSEGTDEFDQFVAFLTRSNDEQGLAATLTVENGEIIVGSALACESASRMRE